MNRILVSGGTGYIGNRLVQTLVHQGRFVRCLVRDSSRAAATLPREVELVQGDLARPESLVGVAHDIDTVFHLAAATRACHPREYWQANALGTGFLARACAQEAHPPVFVYASSLAAVGPARAARPLRESDRAAPVSEYGRGKRDGERMLETLAQFLPVTIVRPAIVFGPGDRSLLPLFQFVARFRCFPLAGLTPGRLSLLFVDDLIECLLRAAERGARLPAIVNGHAGTGCYFAVDGDQPSAVELGRLIARAVGYNSYFPLFIPPLVLGTIGLCNEWIGRARGRSEIFGLDKVYEMYAGDWIASPEASCRDLGFTPAAPLAQRLAETASWYRAHSWL